MWFMPIEKPTYYCHQLNIPSNFLIVSKICWSHPWVKSKVCNPNWTLVRLMSANCLSTCFHPVLVLLPNIQFFLYLVNCSLAISSNPERIILFEWSWLVGFLGVVVLVLSTDAGWFHRWYIASRNFEYTFWNFSLRYKISCWVNKTKYEIDSLALHELTLQCLKSVFYRYWYYVWLCLFNLAYL